MNAPLPANEAARLAALQLTGLLDSAPEQEYDDIVRLAAQICSTPAAAVSLVDADRQWFKASIGLPFFETDRAVAFCAHTLLDTTQPLIVPDTTQDPRFAGNPLVGGAPFIRFYAGAPLVTPDGLAFGSLCVLDHVPRTLSGPQIEALQMLSRLVMRLVEARCQQSEMVRQEESLRQATATLHSQQAELRVLFDYIPAMVVYKDMENRILRANRRMAESAGRTVAEMEGRYVHEIFPESADIFTAQDQEVIRTGVPKLGFIYSYLDRDAREAWIQLDRVPVRDEAGRVTGLVVMGQDITARKLAEEALQQRQSELQVLFDLMPAMVWFKDTANHFLRANRTAAESAGFQVSDFEGRACRELYPDEADRFFADDREVIASGQPKLGIVEPIQGRDGRKLWIQTDKVPYRDGAGKVVGIVVMARDITDRVNARDALEESKRFLQSALNALSSHIAILDEQGVIIAVNHAWQTFAERNGGTGGFGLGENYLHVCGVATGECSEEAAPVVAGLTAVMAGELPEFQLEYPCHSPVEPRWFMLRATRFGGTGPVRVVVAHENITARKLGEERLRLLGSALEQCKDSIVITDARLSQPGPRIQFVNPAFTSMSGYTAAEAVGQTLTIQQGPRTNQAVMLRMVRTLARGKSSQDEVVSYRKDGTTFDLEWHVAPVRNAQGTVTNFVGIQRDVTVRNAAAAELVRAREAALESGRMKSLFLANMSHELRTPLNTINGLAATLLEQELPAHLTSPVGLILQCGESLLQNIQTILTHSSLESGKFSLESRPFSLCEVALNALRMTGDKAHRKGLILDYHFDPRIPALVEGDAFRLQQVLINFLSNAIKFTDRGRVCLRVRALRGGDDYVSLRFMVADTGTGIPADEIGKLFTPFAQADSSGTRRLEGTGLGLAISKTLVDLMGGSVGVRSRVGAGSIFYFTVPFMLASVPQPLGAATAHTGFAGRQILIEESRPLRRRMLREVSQAWRMNPTFVADAAAAAAAAAHRRFDFALRPATGDEPAETDPALPVVWMCSSPAPVPARGRAVNISDLFSVKELSAALASLLSSATVAKPNPGASKRKLGERIPLRILSADDIATNRQMLTYLCRHLGYHTDLVVNGVELVERVKTHTYDLLLVDVNMPRMDGLTAAGEICRLFPDPARRPKLVAVTANALAGDRERCLAAGMDDYLPKPLVPKNLVDCIERLFTEKPAATPPPAPLPKPAPAAQPAVPLVDLDHLRSVTDGMDPADAAELIGQLRDSVVHDYDALRAPLAAACTARESVELEKIVHGLKGCFLSVGWARAGGRCAQAMAALRGGTFQDWTTLAAEIHTLQQESALELSRVLTIYGILSPTPAPVTGS